MFSNQLPDLKTAVDYYGIEFKEFAVVMYHPVTTEFDIIDKHVKEFVDALLEVDNNFIVIYPNNDLGSKKILKEYGRLKNNARFKIFPSLRFEYFLTILKNSQFIIGNSSAGIRESPYYGVPTINIGTRQSNRTNNAEIINVDHKCDLICSAIRNLNKQKPSEVKAIFGSGNSAEQFVNVLCQKETWGIKKQKQFRDIT
jgi:UDP-N-acetylglucosamine 2-epimerase (hydrolysing)